MGLGCRFQFYHFTEYIVAVPLEGIRGRGCTEFMEQQTYGGKGPSCRVGPALNFEMHSVDKEIDIREFFSTTINNNKY